MNKRAAVELLYWNDLSPEQILERLTSKYSDLTLDYVDEVCMMLEGDDFLNEGKVDG